MTRCTERHTIPCITNLALCSIQDTHFTKGQHYSSKSQVSLEKNTTSELIMASAQASSANKPSGPPLTTMTNTQEHKTTHELRARLHQPATLWGLLDEDNFPHLAQTIEDLRIIPDDSEDDSEDEDFKPSSDEEESSEYDSDLNSEYDETASISSAVDDLELDLFGMDAKDVASLLAARDMEGTDAQMQSD